MAIIPDEDLYGCGLDHTSNLQSVDYNECLCKDMLKGTWHELTSANTKALQKKYGNNNVDVTKDHFCCGGTDADEMTTRHTANLEIDEWTLGEFFGSLGVAAHYNDCPGKGGGGKGEHPTAKWKKKHNAKIADYDKKKAANDKLKQTRHSEIAEAQMRPTPTGVWISQHKSKIEAQDRRLGIPNKPGYARE
jgi:hypothetical protein